MPRSPVVWVEHDSRHDWPIELLDCEYERETCGNRSLIEAFFENDPKTDAVVICGGIGGEDKEQGANCIAEYMDTPVAGFIAGRTAPPGKRMGYAGAIVSGSGTGTVESKISALNDAGVPVGDTPGEVVEHVEDQL